MKIIYNRWIPFKGFNAINLFGVLFCKPDSILDATILRHEEIHTRQMKEMLYVFFYLWYVLEWMARLIINDDAYRNISFEREAYAHMYDPLYLSYRPRWAWFKYLRCRS